MSEKELQKVQHAQKIGQDCESSDSEGHGEKMSGAFSSMKEKMGEYMA